MSPHSSDAGPTPEALDQYFAGDSSPEEQVQLAAWATHPQHAQLLAAAREAWNLDRSTKDDWALEANWGRVKASMRTTRTGVRPVDSHTRRGNLSEARRSRWSPPAAFWGVAATVCVLTAGAALWVAAPGIRSGGNAESQIAETVTTRSGERATFRLADGSTVTMAPGSRVYTETGFSRTNRQVYLEGEAVFEVVSRPESPFIVYTAGVATTVLGTRFGVRRYRDDGNVRVVVAEGRVAVGGEVLDAGDVARAVANASPVVTRQQNVEAMLEWTSGRLVFDNITLRDLAAELSRWYNVRVDIADAQVAQIPVTITLNATYSLDVVMQILSTTTGTHVSHRDNVITIAHDTINHR